MEIPLFLKNQKINTTPNYLNDSQYKFDNSYNYLHKSYYQLHKGFDYPMNDFDDLR